MKVWNLWMGMIVHIIAAEFAKFVFLMHYFHVTPRVPFMEIQFVISRQNSRSIFSINKKRTIITIIYRNENFERGKITPNF